ncbi:DUF222 domain-containing protein [Agrococcus jejuensis]|uniref:DUF222 domain-containing protein n=1 Tax=Agrococcus jejuensis TaxID=399736 RepID=UPI000B873165|nr:DUF222 domain-containing protein [Agrococcus jejuensis]
MPGEPRSRRASTPRSSVTVAADVLAGRPARSLDDLPTLSRTGDTVPVSIAARYLCDAFVQTIVQDEQGHPLRMGRRQRLFTKAQRRAIVARDRHCNALAPAHVKRARTTKGPHP